jgi:hypothetical protein
LVRSEVRDGQKCIFRRALETLAAPRWYVLRWVKRVSGWRSESGTRMRAGRSSGGRADSLSS